MNSRVVHWTPTTLTKNSSSMPDLERYMSMSNPMTNITFQPSNIDICSDLHLPHDLFLNCRVRKFLQVIIANSGIVDQDIKALAFELLYDFGRRLLDGILAGDIEFDEVNTRISRCQSFQRGDVVASTGKDLADLGGLARGQLFDESETETAGCAGDQEGRHGGCGAGCCESATYEVVPV